MNNQIFQYNNNPITFMLGNGDVTYISATEMSKPFKKRSTHWLSNQSTDDFLNELSSVRNLTLTDLVKVVNGGNVQGTWFHEDVALEFARWLSPAFAIWYNDRIKELLRTGVATISNDDEVIAQAMTVLQKRLEASRAKSQQLEPQNRLQTEQLQVQAPKAQYYDTVLMSDSTYNTNQVAKELGMSAVTLNKKLQKKNIQYRKGDNGYSSVSIKTEAIPKHVHIILLVLMGEQGTTMQTVWTEKGRCWLHQVLQ